MAIRYYDDALTQKIKSWIKDPNMHVLSPQDSTRLFQMKMDENNDQPLTLPMIAISRDSSVSITNTNKRVLTYDGGHIAMNDGLSATLNAIPMKLNYQIDIYTRYFNEADEYLRNFIFNLINYPRLKINIPYNGANIEHNSTIIVQQEVSDNSDIKERLIAGQFSRMTIRLSIDDAWLFSVPIVNNFDINAKIEEEGN